MLSFCFCAVVEVKQYSGPSLMCPQIFAAAAMDALTSPSHQRSPEFRITAFPSIGLPWVKKRRATRPL